jgi:hypothetical protein
MPTLLRPFCDVALASPKAWGLLNEPGWALHEAMENDWESFEGSNTFLFSPLGAAILTPTISCASMPLSGWTVTTGSFKEITPPWFAKGLKCYDARADQTYSLAQGTAQAAGVSFCVRLIRSAPPEGQTVEPNLKIRFGAETPGSGQMYELWFHRYQIPALYCDGELVSWMNLQPNDMERQWMGEDEGKSWFVVWCIGGAIVIQFSFTEEILVYRPTSGDAVVPAGKVKLTGAGGAFWFNLTPITFAAAGTCEQDYDLGYTPAGTAWSQVWGHNETDTTASLSITAGSTHHKVIQLMLATTNTGHTPVVYGFDVNYGPTFTIVPQTWTTLAGLIDGQERTTCEGGSATADYRFSNAYGLYKTHAGVWAVRVYCGWNGTDEYGAPWSDGTFRFAGYAMISAQTADAETAEVTLRCIDRTAVIKGARTFHFPCYDGWAVHLALTDMIARAGIPPAQITATDLGFTLPMGSYSAPAWLYEDGENVWDIVQDIASMYGAWVYGEPDGTIVIAPATPVPGIAATFRDEPLDDDDYNIMQRLDWEQDCSEVVNDVVVLGRDALGRQLMARVTDSASLLSEGYPGFVGFRQQQIVNSDGLTTQADVDAVAAQLYAFRKRVDLQATFHCPWGCWQLWPNRIIRIVDATTGADGRDYLVRQVTNYYYPDRMEAEVVGQCIPA